VGRAFVQGLSIWKPLAGLGVVAGIITGLILLTMACYRSDLKPIRLLGVLVAMLVCLFSLPFIPWILGLVLFLFGDAFGRLRQAVFILLLAWRIWNGSLLRTFEGKAYILLLRRFRGGSEAGLSKVLRGKSIGFYDPVLGKTRGLGFEYETGQIARVFRDSQLRMASLLNLEARFSFPGWLHFIPVNPPLWQSAVTEFMPRAAGVMMITDDINANLGYELECAAGLSPERVMILLDVAHEDLHPLSGESAGYREPLDRLAARKLVEHWNATCPKALQGRTFAMGSPGIDVKVRSWIETLNQSGEETSNRIP